MVLYEMSLSVLAEKMRGDYPKLIQSWYTDGFITAGAGTYLKPAIAYIEALGNACGLFIEPEK